ncbi:hypothetical protein N008_00035 [Hymenobacter sp. APR13]|nr:hypothetical protein N008_00035 [Hymenobacter sp. APR13]
MDAKDENAKKAVNHPLSKILYRPNPRQSWSEFVTQALGTYLHTGNLFVYVLRVQQGLNTGKPMEFHVMPQSTSVSVASGWMGRVEGYSFISATGSRESFAPSDVLHLKKFNLNDSTYGLSPLVAATLPLTSHNYALRQQIEQLAQGGPKTAVYKDEPDTEGYTSDQKENLKQEFTRNKDFTFVNTKLGKVQLGLSSVELQLLDSINADAGRIADLLGYPSILLSGTKQNTYNNVTEAHKALYKSVISTLHELRDGLNYLVGPFFKDEVYIDLDTSGIEVLKPNLSELITSANSATFMTENEKRKMVGLSAVAGGDGFVRSAGLSYSATIDDNPVEPVDTYDAGDAEVAD